MKRKSGNRKSSRKTVKKMQSNKESMTMDDFKKSKSISIISTMTDLKKKSTVGELYEVDDLKNIMNTQCSKTVGNKVVDGVSMKKISNQICNCLFDKNKDLSLSELEERMKNKMDTPGTECIKIVDAYVAKNRIKSRKSKLRKSKSQKTRKSQKNKSRKSN